MPLSDGDHLLIHRFLDGAAGESDLVEFERRLVADPRFAVVFAEAARLQASLEGHFRKQRKIDEVAALLAQSKSAPSSSPTGQVVTDSPVETDEVGSLPRSPVPTFVPTYRWWHNARGGRLENVPAGAAARRTGVRWTRFAAALLVLALGAALWHTQRSGGEGAVELADGQVLVAGRAVSVIPRGIPFEVAGQRPAVVDLGAGTRIELAPATRASIRREAGQIVVQLDSGRGEIRTARGQPSVLVATALGSIRAEESRFTVEVVTSLPEGVTPTPSVRLPTLLVVVAEGAVTIEQAGQSIRLESGQDRLFMNST